ncbi:MAG: adaptor protein MecA [Eubacteriales bacterium]|nr:adaptor protein MecA [Eubacteriales bacterium]
MNIERVNENTIKCTLTRTDLQARNMDVRDMAYGSLEARKLFEEMMQKAKNEVGFDLSHELMIEAIPLSDGAIQLIISSVEDPDELDARFSKFAQNVNQNDIKDIAREFIEGALAALDRSNGGAPLQPNQKVNDNVSILDSEVIVRIFAFDEMDKITDACRNLSYTDYESVLYKDEDKRKYYLVLTCKNDVEKRDQFNKVCNTLAEYGNKIPNELNEAYYEEHYKTIIKQNAVEKLMLL